MATSKEKVRVCFVDDCSTPIPEPLLFCGKHWSLLPSWFRSRIRSFYRPGQPSTPHFKSYVRKAIASIKLAEQKQSESK